MMIRVALVALAGAAVILVLVALVPQPVIAAEPPSLGCASGAFAHQRVQLSTPQPVPVSLRLRPLFRREMYRHDGWLKPEIFQHRVSCQSQVLSAEVLLSEAPSRIVIDCKTCGRHGQYDRARAIQKHGDIGLPTFLNTVVGEVCDRKRDVSHFGGCQARFVHLS